MKRRVFFLGLASSAAILGSAGSAMAMSFADDVIGQLTSQGFSSISMQTTWLGRVRIVAFRDGGQREIILNPRTGEILRDSWTAAAGGTTKPIVDDVASSGNGSSGGSSGGGTSDGGDGSSGGGSGSDDGGSDGGSDSGGGSGSGSGSGGEHEDDSHETNDDKNDKGGKDN
ncbi:MAG: hypothetical protein ABI832_04220 [bacterium]